MNPLGFICLLVTGKQKLQAELTENLPLNVEWMICMTQAKCTVFAFSSLLNMEKYTVNLVDFMSVTSTYVQWTCTVSRC